jgi:hypothetical protein
VLGNLAADRADLYAPCALLPWRQHLTEACQRSVQKLQDRLQATLAAETEP